MKNTLIFLFLLFFSTLSKAQKSEEFYDLSSDEVVKIEQLIIENQIICGEATPFYDEGHFIFSGIGGFGDFEPTEWKDLSFIGNTFAHNFYFCTNS